MNHSGDDVGWVGCFVAGNPKDEWVEDTGVAGAHSEEIEMENTAGAENTSAKIVADRIAAVVQVERAAVGVDIAIVDVENAAVAEAETAAFGGADVVHASAGPAAVDLVAAGLVAVGHASAGHAAVDLVAAGLEVVELASAGRAAVDLAVVCFVAVGPVIAVVPEADDVEGRVVEAFHQTFVERRLSLCG